MPSVRRGDIDVKFRCSDGHLECTDGDLTVLGTLGPIEDQLAYLMALRKPFIKICRLRFLNPDGSVAFALDNNQYRNKGENKRHESSTFISDGNLSVNLQNGQRRSAEVTLSNIDGEYEYSYNNLWFGQEIALDEGLKLDDGTEYYIQQGVFLIDTPQEIISPNERTIKLPLVDKWANLDGTLYGNLEGTYEIASGTNIFTAIASLLDEDRGNGVKVDRIKPIYTNYYDDKTQTLPDGTTVAMNVSPYTLTLDSESATLADVIIGLNEMINGLIGYDQFGALRIEPSQDDISDDDKPVQWRFSREETSLMGMTYTTNNTEVYNDYIVVGEELDDYTQPSGRAQNLDPSSATNVNAIGRKTIRVSASGYATDQQCKDLAQWKLKRTTVLQNSINISCSQLFHISENSLIELVRTDKEGSPTERHLIQGFTRPLVGTGTMTISCVSVQDFPIATVTTDV